MQIAVLGSMNMDMVVESEVIPKPGETVQGKSIDYLPGGKGANQAVAAAKLGGNVSMFACVGDDSAGEALIKNLQANNVNTENIKKIKAVPTGTALITVGGGDNSIVVVAGANEFVNADYVDSVKDKLLSADIVILQNEIPEETNKYVIDLFHSNNKKILLNPAPARPLEHDLIAKLNYLTPNEHEAEMLFGDVQAITEALKLYPQKLVVTLGKNGVIAASDDNTKIKISAKKTTVVDTTGAGDTFNGAFAFCISSGETFENALKFANIAASVSVESYGAQPGMPTYSQVKEAMELSE